MFFFFKQKTAYEMRISDWSSDVCSSDLHNIRKVPHLKVADSLRSAAHRSAKRETVRFVRVRGNINIQPDNTTPVGNSAVLLESSDDQIGRASCRERVCQYV